MTCPVCGFAEKKGGKPRSLDQHRRFFGLCRATFAHWPEAHERQFADEHELRAWLTMKAGWRDVAAQIPLAGLARDKALVLVEASIRAAGSFAMPVLHKGTLVIWKPRSIKFATMAHIEFCSLSNAVDDVIRAETGIDPEQLLKEHERAA